MSLKNKVMKYIKSQAQNLGNRGDDMTNAVKESSQDELLGSIEPRHRKSFCESCRSSQSAQAGNNWRARLDETLELSRSLDEIDRDSSLGCPLCKWMFAIIQPELEESPGAKLHITLNFSDAYWVIKWRNERYYGERVLDSRITFRFRENRLEGKTTLENAPLRKQPNRDPASDAVFALVSGWIEYCDLRHRQCKQARSHVPTRLINVSKAEPRLQIMKSKHVAVPYITLSHCWGQAQPLTTTMATIKQFEKQIPMSALPPTFQDAVKITRKLGVDYIWIDSLCIIQDSIKDWERESAKMKDCYQNSFLTLSAVSAEDSQGGMLFRRQDVPNIDLGEGWYTGPYKKGKEITSAPLYQRCWALQERVLSPRILHYWSQELFWECRTSCWLESESNLLNPGPRLTLDKAGDKYFDTVPVSCDGRKLFLIWPAIVEEYSRRLLTKASDKLPAIAGLAGLAASGAESTYLAGIWKEHLPRALLWIKSSSSLQRQTGGDFEGYVAPSWSWASMDTRVGYPELRRMDSHSEQLCEILSAGTTLATANVYGAVTKGEMCIRGPLLEVRLQQCDPMSQASWEWTGHGKRIWLQLDRESNATREHCYLLLIRVTISKIGTNIDRLEYLAIRRGELAGDGWRRIGAGYTCDMDTKDEMLEMSEVRAVTLI